MVGVATDKLLPKVTGTYNSSHPRESSELIPNLVEAN